MYHLVINAIYIHLFLGNTPHVILGTQRPISPISEIGTGLTWWSIHFNRVVINPLFFILYSLPFKELLVCRPLLVF